MGRGIGGAAVESGWRADVPQSAPTVRDAGAYTDVGAGALDGPWRTDSIAGASMVRR